MRCFLSYSTKGRLYQETNTMKINSIIAGLMLFWVTAAQAQFGVGARVGVSMSTMVGVRGADLIPNPGLVTGVSGEFRLVDNQSLSFYLQPEFALEQKGYATKFTSGSFRSETQYNFDYASLPVAAKLIFGSGKFKGGINVGVAPALLIGRYAQYKNSDGDRSRTVISRSSVKVFDINAFIGGVMEYALGPGALFADLRYTQGFVDPFSSYLAKPHLGSSYLNASPSFSVGYVFRIGGGKTSSVPSGSSYSDPSDSGFTDIENTQEEPETVWEDESEPVETRPSTIDEEVSKSSSQELRPSPKPRENTAAVSSDFEEMIELNKHFDVIADVHASDTDKEISKTEILSRFKHGDVLVKIEIDKVVVDYFGINEFLGAIRLNHSRYKIADRIKDENGMISEITMRKIG